MEIIIYSKYHAWNFHTYNTCVASSFTGLLGNPGWTDDAVVGNLFLRKVEKNI